MADDRKLKQDQFFGVMTSQWEADRMEGRLRRGVSFLMRQLLTEFSELWQAIERSATVEIRGSTARVANYGTALADLAGALEGLPRPESSFTLRRLQQENQEWAERNFPNRLPHQPLLGAGEEIGELMHAHLKSEQGIRGTAAEHHAAKKDAVGDAIIYLADYCTLNDLDLQKAVEETWEGVLERDWQKNPANGDATADVTTSGAL